MKYSYHASNVSALIKGYLVLQDIPPQIMEGIKDLIKIFLLFVKYLFL